jgi:hypothetical protein
MNPGTGQKHFPPMCWWGLRNWDLPPKSYCRPTLITEASI